MASLINSQSDFVNETFNKSRIKIRSLVKKIKGLKLQVKQYQIAHNGYASEKVVSKNQINCKNLLSEITRARNDLFEVINATGAYFECPLCEIELLWTEESLDLHLTNIHFQLDTPLRNKIKETHVYDQIYRMEIANERILSTFIDSYVTGCDNPILLGSKGQVSANENNVNKYMKLRKYPRYYCILCASVKYRNKRKVIAHIEKLHNGIDESILLETRCDIKIGPKLYYCNLCPKMSFQSRRLIAAHFKSFHMGLEMAGSIHCSFYKESKENSMESIDLTIDDDDDTDISCETHMTSVEMHQSCSDNSQCNSEGSSRNNNFMSDIDELRLENTAAAKPIQLHSKNDKNSINLIENNSENKDDSSDRLLDELDEVINEIDLSLSMSSKSDLSFEATSSEKSLNLKDLLIEEKEYRELLENINEIICDDGIQDFNRSSDSILDLEEPDTVKILDEVNELISEMDTFHMQHKDSNKSPNNFSFDQISSKKPTTLSFPSPFSETNLFNKCTKSKKKKKKSKACRVQKKIKLTKFKYGVRHVADEYKPENLQDSLESCDTVCLSNNEISVLKNPKETTINAVANILKETMEPHCQTIGNIAEMELIDLTTDDEFVEEDKPLYLNACSDIVKMGEIAEISQENPDKDNLPTKRKIDSTDSGENISNVHPIIDNLSVEILDDEDIEERVNLVPLVNKTNYEIIDMDLDSEENFDDESKSNNNDVEITSNSANDEPVILNDATEVTSCNNSANSDIIKGEKDQKDLEVENRADQKFDVIEIDNEYFDITDEVNKTVMDVATTNKENFNTKIKGRRKATIWERQTVPVKEFFINCKCRSCPWKRFKKLEFAINHIKATHGEEQVKNLLYGENVLEPTVASDLVSKVTAPLSTFNYRKNKSPVLAGFWGKRSVRGKPLYLNTCPDIVKICEIAEISRETPAEENLTNDREIDSIDNEDTVKSSAKHTCSKTYSGENHLKEDPIKKTIIENVSIEILDDGGLEEIVNLIPLLNKTNSEIINMDLKSEENVDDECKSNNKNIVKITSNSVNNDQDILNDTIEVTSCDNSDNFNIKIKKDKTELEVENRADQKFDVIEIGSQYFEILDDIAVTLREDGVTENNLHEQNEFCNRRSQEIETTTNDLPVKALEKDLQKSNSKTNNINISNNDGVEAVVKDSNHGDTNVRYSTKLQDNDSFRIESLEKEDVENEDSFISIDIDSTYFDITDEDNDTVMDVEATNRDSTVKQELVNKKSQKDNLDPSSKANRKNTDTKIKGSKKKHCKYKCKSCPDTIYKKQKRAIKHIKKVHGIEQVKNLLDGEYTLGEDRTVPMKVLYSNYKCKLCPSRVFRNQLSVISHIKSKHKKDQVQNLLHEEDNIGENQTVPGKQLYCKYKCKWCPYKLFQKQLSLISHINSKHGEDLVQHLLVKEDNIESQKRKAKDIPLECEVTKKYRMDNIAPNINEGPTGTFDLVSEVTAPLTTFNYQKNNPPFSVGFCGKRSVKDKPLPGIVKINENAKISQNPAKENLTNNKEIDSIDNTNKYDTIKSSVKHTCSTNDSGENILNADPIKKFIIDTVSIEILDDEEVKERENLVPLVPLLNKTNGKIIDMDLESEENVNLERKSNSNIEITSNSVNNDQDILNDAIEVTSCDNGANRADQKFDGIEIDTQYFEILDVVDVILSKDGLTEDNLPSTQNEFCNKSSQTEIETTTGDVPVKAIVKDLQKSSTETNNINISNNGMEAIVNDSNHGDIIVRYSTELQDNDSIRIGNVENEGSECEKGFFPIDIDSEFFEITDEVDDTVMDVGATKKDSFEKQNELVNGKSQKDVGTTKKTTKPIPAISKIVVPSSDGTRENSESKIKGPSNANSCKNQTVPAKQLYSNYKCKYCPKKEFKKQEFAIEHIKALHGKEQVKNVLYGEDIKGGSILLPLDANRSENKTVPVNQLFCKFRCKLCPNSQFNIKESVISHIIFTHGRGQMKHLLLDGEDKIESQKRKADSPLESEVTKKPLKDNTSPIIKQNTNAEPAVTTVSVSEVTAPLGTFNYKKDKTSSLVYPYTPPVLVGYWGKHGAPRFPQINCNFWPFD